MADKEKELGIERTAPEIVVTPGMIEAGVKAFGPDRGEDIGEALERAFRAMAALSGGTGNPPAPPPPPPPGQGGGNEQGGG